MKANRGTIIEYAHYPNQESKRGTKCAQENIYPPTEQHVTRCRIMPSQTVHFPTSVYEYALNTRGDEESMSNRLADLARKGMESERNDDTE